MSISKIVPLAFGVLLTNYTVVAAIDEHNISQKNLRGSAFLQDGEAEKEKDEEKAREKEKEKEKEREKEKEKEKEREKEKSVEKVYTKEEWEKLLKEQEKEGRSGEKEGRSGGLGSTVVAILYRCSY